MDDLVICPNGHPNRPGRSQCVVCKAPLEMPAELDVPPPPPPPTPPAAVETKAAEPAKSGEKPAEGHTNGGCGRWVLLSALGLIAIGVVLVAIFWPQIRTATEQTPLVPPTVVEPTAVGVVAPVEPTPLPLPTATLPPPTTAPTTMPEATDAPTVVSPELTPTAQPTDDSQPLDHGNLIANGDFAEGWLDTWLRQVSSNNGVQASEIVDFENAPVPFGLRLSKTGTGTTRLEQIIDVPRRATELRFVGDIRLVGSVAENGVSEGRTALMIVYMDEEGKSLGYSVWMDGSQPSSELWGISPLPEFGPQLSPRFVVGEEWQAIDVRLQEEFVNRLPGLDAGRVRQIGINLLALASDTCEPADCSVSMEVGNLQFLPTEMQ